MHRFPATACLAWLSVFTVAAVLIGGCGEEPPKPRARVVEAAPVPPEPVEAPTSMAMVTPPRAEPELWTPRVTCDPIEERGYRKGKGFDIIVLEIDGRLVERDTARAYLAMQAAAAEDGVSLPIYSGFRTQAEQKYFYRCYKTCSCNSCVKAARPGHSNNQSGRALDIGLWDGTEAWLREKSGAFYLRPAAGRSALNLSPR